MSATPPATPPLGNKVRAGVAIGCGFLGLLVVASCVIVVDRKTPDIPQRQLSQAELDQRQQAQNQLNQQHQQEEVAAIAKVNRNAAEAYARWKGVARIFEEKGSGVERFEVTRPGVLRVHLSPGTVQLLSAPQAAQRVAASAQKRLGDAGEVTFITPTNQILATATRAGVK